MLRKDFILCKTRSLLNEFMTPITEKQIRQDRGSYARRLKRMRLNLSTLAL